MEHHPITDLSLAHQMLGIESVYNARQLGGYRIGNKQIKPNLLLRSASLAKLSINTPEQRLVAQTMLSANPQLFSQAFNKVVKQYGSLTAYLTNCLGVTEEMMEQLRHHYLEPVCNE